MAPQKQHWLYNNDVELQYAVAKWDAQFAKRIKKKKFEDINLRPPYTPSLKKKDFKNKKWT